ncbi:MAG: cytochrome c-type biogenesis protein CcmH, partial [Thiotrichales bacterium]|nr:cytochrome c-type biogenesis protein CcmH [Thiotrichales bacterium]
MFKSICITLLLMFPAHVFAEIAGFPFKDTVQEQQFRDLSGQLRCLVCQNQSLADSNAALARDLRNELYEQVTSGQSDEEIIRFMIDRYGDFILYKPRFNASTWLLWLTPFLLLLTGIICLIRYGRGRLHPEDNVVTKEELEK